MVTGAEVLAIFLAIAALTSGFNSGVELIKTIKAKWQAHQASRTQLAELEKLQESLLRAGSSVQTAYDVPRQRYGHIFQVGDDLARHILFALAARQEPLLAKLRSMEPGNANVLSLIAGIERTRMAAARCLDELAARAQRPSPPLRVSLQDQAALLMDYQNLCPSAALYRTRQAPHSQLAAIFGDYERSSCHHCGVVITPSKIAIPGADASSCVLMDLSGLFRAHCRAGDGWTCIWQPRAPSCYGVFGDRKALLKHVVAVHVRDDQGAPHIHVDWPADVRRGDFDKCGFSVHINGLRMRSHNGDLVVPRRRGVTGAGPRAVDVDDSESIASSVTAVERDPFEADGMI